MLIRLVPRFLLFFLPLLLALALVIFFFPSPMQEPEAEPLSHEVFEVLEATDFHNALIPALSPPPQWEQYTLQTGDRLSLLWQNRMHLPLATLYRLLDQREGARLLNRIHPGQHIEWLASRDGQLLALRIWSNRAEGHEWVRDGQQFTFSSLSNQREVRYVRLEGVLDGILINSLQNMPEIAGQEGAIAAALDRHLPLRRDARNGDRFSLLVEQEWLSGDPRPYSTRLMAFEYQGSRLQIRAARHSDDRFYTPNGDSLIAPFSRTPLAQNFRISSHFNLNRRHPVTGRVQPHYGTDFATPIGTPVIAPADGTVLRRGWHPYAGHYVVLAHGQGYETRYLHLNRILVDRGQSVRRGQQIAQTGNSGRSTGPHLHYELHINGRPVNAMRVELPSTERLEGQDLEQFTEQSRHLFATLDQQMSTRQLALSIRSTPSS